MKQAVITNHIVNYIGLLNQNNRNSGLKQLNELLNRILKMYLNVQLLTSSQLGNITVGNGFKKV
jgi:hypothetical protein